jgi:hypothetical protein
MKIFSQASKQNKPKYMNIISIIICAEYNKIEQLKIFEVNNKYKPAYK